jgi:hypothetical protein
MRPGCYCPPVLSISLSLPRLSPTTSFKVTAWGVPQRSQSGAQALSPKQSSAASSTMILYKNIFTVGISFFLLQRALLDSAAQHLTRLTGRYAFSLQWDQLMSIAISRCGDEPWHHKELAEHCLSLTTDCLGGVRGSIQMIIQLYIFLPLLFARGDWELHTYYGKGQRGRIDADAQSSRLTLLWSSAVTKNL